MILAYVSNRLLKGSQTRLAAIGIFVLAFFCLALHRRPGNSMAPGDRFSSKKQKSDNPTNLQGSEVLEHNTEPRAPDLQDISVIHHGRIIEVKGAAEPGAIVMINGEPAVTFFDGNRFKHFVGPISPGTTVISITVQNDMGGVTTRQLAVTID